MVHRFFLTVAFTCAAAIAGATTVPSVPPPDVPGADLLLRVETQVYSEEGSTEEVTELLGEARRLFRTIPDVSLRTYWEARAVLLLGSHLNHVGETRQAGRILPEGLDLIRQSLQAGDYSDGLRVLADLHSQMTISRGLFHMMRHGEEARSATMRALDLDRENIRALITAAGYYLNAPRIAGGSVPDGIRHLELALSKDPPDQNDRFMILGWLAEAHQSVGEEDRAREYARQALTIYPRSRWVREILSSI